MGGNHFRAANFAKWNPGIRHTPTMNIIINLIRRVLGNTIKTRENLAKSRWLTAIPFSFSEGNWPAY